MNFSDLRGQESIKKALEVAATGDHNAIMIVPPGAGKTMLAKRSPTFLIKSIILNPDLSACQTKIDFGLNKVYLYIYKMISTQCSVVNCGNYFRREV